MSERKEAFIRIIILIVAWVMLIVWRWFVIVLIVLNFFYVLFSGKRHREIANLSELWNTQWYVFQRYIIFQSNRRPFPFGRLEKSISKHDPRPARRFKKKKK